MRRDFTINGMFYDPLADQVIDYVDGRSDLASGVIRTIGPPDQRFAEDHLRLVRAVRFAARFEYTIHPETYDAIRKHAPSITRVSAERIREELEKIMVDRHRARALDNLSAVGLLDHLWPDSEWTAQRVTLSASLLGRLPDRVGFGLSLACLLIHWSVKEVNRICRDLTCSNGLRRRVAWLVEHADALTDPDALGLADLKLLMQRPAFGDLLTLTRARLEASDRPLTAYERVLERVGAIPPDEVAPPPLIDGQALIEMGLSPGPIFKRVLDRVYRAQLEGEVTSKDEAAALARQEVRQA